MVLICVLTQVELSGKWTVAKYWCCAVAFYCKLLLTTHKSTLNRVLDDSCGF